MAQPTANDEEWAQAEGVPSLADPFIQKYLTGRDALVEQEKRQRSGWLATQCDKQSISSWPDWHQTACSA
jgi:adenosine deaminase CECR1